MYSGPQRNYKFKPESFPQKNSVLIIKTEFTIIINPKLQR